MNAALTTTYVQSWHRSFANKSPLLPDVLENAVASRELSERQIRPAATSPPLPRALDHCVRARQNIPTQKNKWTKFCATVFTS